MIYWKKESDAISKKHDHILDKSWLSSWIFFLSNDSKDIKAHWKWIRWVNRMFFDVYAYIVMGLHLSNDIK